VLQTRFGDNLGLYGYSLDFDSNITLTFVWYTYLEVKESYTVFVHVIDEHGNIAAQHDSTPNDNLYPTSLWSEGEYVADSHTFTTLSPGTYTFRVGLYLQSNGKRLPVASAAEPTDFIEIGPVDIAG
jgi:hypothetical protein